MPNKLRVQFEGLALRALFATVQAKNQLVKITADRKVDAAGADAIVVGRVVKPAKAVDGTGTIETPFKEMIEIKADGAIAAGDRVKMSSDSPAGTQRVKKYTTLGVGAGPAFTGDLPDLILGVCWKGGADGATVEVLIY